MRKLFLHITFFFLGPFAIATPDSSNVTADTSGTFTSLESASKNPDKVVRLVLSKQKLTEIPAVIFTFKHLEYLDLSKNKIKVIPKEIGSLVKLVELNLSKNKLTAMPAELFNCTNLQRLIINQNEITGIPPEIRYLKKLVYLDMWSNDIWDVAEEISQLKNLKEADFRVVQFTIEEQDRIRKLLPNTKLWFSNSCNCSK